MTDLVPDLKLDDACTVSTTLGSVESFYVESLTVLNAMIAIRQIVATRQHATCNSAPSVNIGMSAMEGMTLRLPAMIAPV